MTDLPENISQDVKDLNPEVFDVQQVTRPSNKGIKEQEMITSTTFPESEVNSYAWNLQARKNKFHAVRTWSTLCQFWFDSKAEARRGEELYLLQKAGEIDMLEFQIPFVLNKKPKVTITIDFSYLQNKVIVYEDAKGILTRDFRTKLAWLKETHGIDVKLIR